MLWSTQDQQEFIDEFESGMTVTEIAGAHQLPRSAVVGLLHSLGVVTGAGYRPRKDERENNLFYKRYYSEQ